MSELKAKLTELEQKRTWLEAQLDKVTSLDERLALLTQVNLRILEALQTQIPQPVQPTQDIASYFTKYFPLDTARTNEEIQVSGNTLLAFCDGDLSECSVRLDTPINDSISLLEFNGAYLGAGFEKLYLTTSAQTGKYLRLLIIRGVGSSVAGINIQAQSAGIFLQPEWSARQGIDKDLIAFNCSQGYNGYGEGTYTVATGKTLFITGVEACCFASLTDDMDLAQHFWARLLIGTTVKCSFGGDGGGIANLTKPIVVDAGEKLTYRINVRAKHLCDIFLSVHGYEV